MTTQNIAQPKVRNAIRTHTALSYLSSNSNRPVADGTLPMPHGRVEIIPASYPPRSWSVSPPSCAAEQPRPNIGYCEYYDVSPLSSPDLTPHKTYTPEEKVGHNHALLPDSITDDGTCGISPQSLPTSPSVRPTELHFPESWVSEVHRTNTQPWVSDVHRTNTSCSSKRRNIAQLFDSGANAVRAVVALGRPKMQRRNAVRKRSMSPDSPQLPLERATETGTLELRLGLIGKGQVVDHS